MGGYFKIYTIFNSEISFNKNTILKHLLSVLEIEVYVKRLQYDQ